MIYTLGSDWKNAPLALREQLALGEEDVSRLLEQIKQLPGVSGCALIQTCNRLEVYWQTEEPEAILALRQEITHQLIPSPPDDFALSFMAGQEACRHLMEVACGLHSQILGEEQILTQVRRAAELAREHKSASPTLETLFRLAVTAGKESRTKVAFQAVPSSSPARALELAATALGSLTGRQALVIGNGEIGRLTAELLVKAGCQVTVTLRSYRHGQTVVPRGCQTIAYDHRTQAMEGCDLLVSATRSPHYTVTRAMLEPLDALPRLVVDMALPRDIEPECGQLLGTSLLNLDDLQSGPQSENAPQLEQVARIIDKHLGDFEHWQRHRALRFNPHQPPRFPLFINLEHHPCLVVGCGPVGLRRTRVLQEFGAKVTVISPHCSGDPWNATVLTRFFEPGDTSGMALVVAATDNRQVNEQIARECRQHHIPVSVVDCPEESTFFFPAVCQSQNLMAGLVSKNGDHRLTARSAAKLRQWMKELDP